jgi:hypothetical protein
MPRRDDDVKGVVAASKLTPLAVVVQDQKQRPVTASDTAEARSCDRVPSQWLLSHARQSRATGGTPASHAIFRMPV